ncbi:MAG: transcriptional activator FtrB [Firmicutes bacterium ADurb.Bin182]|nr:MAG: transcriptional activator FtrB [Firmicutes bacterium ADurb.Bin182]
MNSVKNEFNGSSSQYVIEDNFASYRAFILENCGKIIEFPAGTCLSRGGQPVKCMYFLLNGTVKIYTVNIDGYVRLLGYHKKNTIFVLDGLRQDQNAIVTSEAVSNIRVVELSLQDIRRLCKKNYEFFFDLLLYYCDVLRLMCFDAESQSIDGVDTRLANFIALYMQSENYRRIRYIPMSQDNLASAINASRIQTARVCAKFKQEGIISIEKRKLIINDENKLRKFQAKRNEEQC